MQQVGNQNTTKRLALSYPGITTLQNELKKVIVKRDDQILEQAEWMDGRRGVRMSLNRKKHGKNLDSFITLCPQ